MKRFRNSNRGTRAGLPLVVVCLLGIWSLTAILVRTPMLPAPDSAFSSLLAMATDGRLLRHGAASLSRVFLALLASFVPAAAAGLAAGRIRRVDAVVSPIVYLLHPLPKAAFLPLIMLAFGLGELSKVVLVAFIIFSQILVAARDASSRVPAQLVDSVRSLGASRFQLALFVVLPATLPDLLTALRVSLGTAMAVLFLAETFATDLGLGYLIMDAWARIDYPDMYAAILALSLLGVALFVLVDALERWVCPWKRRDD